MDDDIAHVARVMVPSLSAFLGEPVIPPSYWRKRLHRMQGAFHLTDSQASTIRRLLGELELFEAQAPVRNRTIGDRARAACANQRWQYKLIG
jgi:hypothetical protein